MILLETKVTRERAVRVLQVIRHLYPNSDLTFGNGFMGGLWVFWDLTRVTLEKLDGSEQHATVHAKPVTNSHKPFFFTTLCASP